MDSEESGKYGDFDPTAFRMDDEPADSEKPDNLRGESVKSKPVDDEIERSPEKVADKEIQVSPEEYTQALERVLTGPDRERLLDKTNQILELLKKVDPDKKAEIIAVLKDTFSEIHRSSDNLKEAYETIEPFLDDILGELEQKQ